MKRMLLLAGLFVAGVASAQSTDAFVRQLHAALHCARLVALDTVAAPQEVQEQLGVDRLEYMEWACAGGLNVGGYVKVKQWRAGGRAICTITWDAAGGIRRMTASTVVPCEVLEAAHNDP